MIIIDKQLSPNTDEKSEDDISAERVMEPVFTLPAEGTLIISPVTSNTYKIGSLIGEGNFGYVYECSDTWANELAVKILKPLGTYEEVMQSTIAEFEKLKLLRHPNITYVI